ncbi:MAG: ABC transporter ATP-binding protein [Thermoanaerobacteraceae bacterium]|nr:ABC transporter ATP-binding protein [Thermoanaerobacteraceae bacterium]
MNAIEVRDLHFSIGDKKILNGITIDISQGMVTGILGPNGAGKTTLLRHLSGYWQPEKDTVHIFGVDILRLKPRDKAKIIGLVPQDGVNSAGFSVFEMVMMGRSPYLNFFGNEKADDRKIVDDCLKTCGVYDIKDRKMYEISGGEAQRVLIARALAQQPEILLLDEPVSHLDIKYQLEIMSLLKDLSRKGMTVVSIIHDLNIALNFCDNVILLNYGRVIAEGDADSVINEENIYRTYGVRAMVEKGTYSVVIPALKAI